MRLPIPGSFRAVLSHSQTSSPSKDCASSQALAFSQAPFVLSSPPPRLLHPPRIAHPPRLLPSPRLLSSCPLPLTDFFTILGLCILPGTCTIRGSCTLPDPFTIPGPWSLPRAIIISLSGSCQDISFQAPVPFHSYVTSQAQAHSLVKSSPMPLPTQTPILLPLFPFNAPPQSLCLPGSCRAVLSHSQTSSPSASSQALAPCQTHSLSLVPAPCHHHVLSHSRLLSPSIPMPPGPSH